MNSAPPPIEDPWYFENGFHLTAAPSRIAKILAHWELYKMASEVPGAIVECGVFKGASFACWASFRNLTNSEDRPLIGFDTFASYPHTDYEPDKRQRASFIQEAGEQSITSDELMNVLRLKRCARNVELVAGDIRDTVPAYVEEHSGLQIALLNVDVDVYEPSVVVLEHLYPRLVKGGILVLDDYMAFPGETAAVDEYFTACGLDADLRRFPFRETPYYVIK